MYEMKKNFKRVLAILLVAACLTSFIACSKKDLNNNVINGVFNEFLIAEKIGTVNRDNFSTNEGGLTYKGDNDLWGVISFEGLRDTGAIFSKVVSIGKYFQVRVAAPQSSNDIAGLNASYLIDGKGKTIIPAGYAAFDILNDRYILAARATENTVDKTKAVVTYNTETGLTHTTSYLLNENEFWYAGSWCVFDTRTGTPVLGASGDYAANISARGDFISFDNAADEKVCINAKGVALPEGAYLFNDGSYKVEGKIGEVFSTDGTKLFSYDLTGYQPSQYYEGGYYAASKYVDGTSTYAVLNSEGKILSDGYSESVTLYGDIIHSGEKIYNLNGENIIEGAYTSVKNDRVFGNNWMLHNNSYYTLIDNQGRVYYNGGGEDTDVFASDFVASVKKDGDSYYFSHKDQDYTIKGYHFAPWIVETPAANSMSNLVDTMTGKTLLEGYNDYDSISRNSLAYYVYAKYNGGADVYLIVSGAQIAEVTAKKTKLYDDLLSAFSAEGISATINKETGEISLDSSVLFGGDSAELTANGKTFLNKFIKAYTNVVYSDEYTGFISKTMVEGHTAPVSGSTYAGDYDLSMQRAANVKGYCLSGETGIDIAPMANTLEAVGYSNSQPVYSESGEVDMAASRRVSFRFMVNIEL